MNFHWYPKNLNVWFNVKQNFGCYLVTWHCSQFPISSLHMLCPLQSKWPRNRLIPILETLFRVAGKCKYVLLAAILSCSRRGQVETLQIYNVHVGWPVTTLVGDGCEWWECTAWCTLSAWYHTHPGTNLMSQAVTDITPRDKARVTQASTSNMSQGVPGLLSSVSGAR